MIPAAGLVYNLQNAIHYFWIKYYVLVCFEVFYESHDCYAFVINIHCDMLWQDLTRTTYCFKLFLTTLKIHGRRVFPQNSKRCPKTDAQKWNVNCARVS